MKSDPATWLDSYGDTLYRYALVKTGNPAIAEDLVQETLIAALKGHDSFKQQSSEKTWIIGILKHKVLDHYRKSSREQPLEQDAELSQYDEVLFDEQGHWRNPAHSWGDPSQAIDDVGFINILKECLETLPRRQADLFLLSELQDMDNESLCKLLDISSTNNLWVILSRVRSRLRECIDLKWFKPVRG